MVEALGSLVSERILNYVLLWSENVLVKKEIFKGFRSLQMISNKLKKQKASRMIEVSVCKTDCGTCLGMP